MAAVLLALMLCIGWSSGALADHVKDGRATHRIVVQVDEDNPQLWNLLLNNIGNIIGAMGREHVDIKVVAYGPGINMFRKGKSSVLDRLDSLKKFAGPHVGFTVCSNTMKAMQVEKGEIIELVDDLYPGIVRVVELQEQGYVYLRP
jgi:intracellular sulfur oxidation DsrE/DsrF family protein